MSLKSEVEASGFVLVKSLFPKLDLTDLAPNLGRIWDKIPNHSAHAITPEHKIVATPNTYSGNYGLDEFPLHTDLAHWRMPPKYLVLRCRTGNPNVATLLLDGNSIVAHCSKAILAKALVEPRRPLFKRIPLLRIYEQSDDCMGLLRWDSLFIQPASRNGKKGYDQVKQFICDSESVSIFLQNPGDTLIIDNWRMLHGRSSVLEICKTRVIERVYLESIK